MEDIEKKLEKFVEWMRWHKGGGHVYLCDSCMDKVDGKFEEIFGIDFDEFLLRNISMEQRKKNFDNYMGKLEKRKEELKNE